MSQSWAKGSTRAWRKVRARVLARDNYECKLNLDGCTLIATEAHHTMGRRITGDDSVFIVGSCKNCNLKVGDPTRHPDPQPVQRTLW